MATSEGASPARQVAPALDEAQLVKIIRDELDKFFEKHGDDLFRTTKPRNKASKDIAAQIAALSEKVTQLDEKVTKCIDSMTDGLKTIKKLSLFQPFKDSASGRPQWKSNPKEERKEETFDRVTS